jgi:hypothetical protein
VSNVPRHLEGFDWQVALTTWKRNGNGRTWEVLMPSSEAMPGKEIWSVTLKWCGRNGPAFVVSKITTHSDAIGLAVEIALQQFRETSK